MQVDAGGGTGTNYEWQGAGGGMMILSIMNNTLFLKTQTGLR
jgi:hypothetical protein